MLNEILFVILSLLSIANLALFIALGISGLKVQREKIRLRRAIREFKKLTEITEALQRSAIDQIVKMSSEELDAFIQSLRNKE